METGSGRNNPAADRIIGAMERNGAGDAQCAKSHYIGNGIGWAVKQMWNGGQVRRRGWNGRGMHVALQIPDQNSKMTCPYAYIKTAQGELVPWLCSQKDLLASDWELAEY